jgi:hypothetical protein
MGGMESDFDPSDIRVVDPLVVEVLVGDGVVLEPGVEPMPVRVNVRPDIVHGQVEADVSVEVSIMGIPRITVLGAPHLLRGLRVSPKSRDPPRTVNRRVDSVNGSAVGMENGVGIDNEVANSRLVEKLVHTRHVPAFP